MSEQPWYQQFFGHEYFEIYQDHLSEELTRSQVDGIERLLELPSGSRILDLACGHGRHAIPLAQRGYRITGFDLSEVFLNAAKEASDRAGTDITWVRGDMRQLDFDSEFDAVINIFTAFGYFEDPADDLEVLRGVRRALVPGGKLLIEVLNRDALVGRFQRRWFDVNSTGTIVLHASEWDLASDVLDDEVTLIRPEGDRVQMRTAVRLRSLSSYVSLLREAELDPVGWYAGLSGQPFDMTSFRLAILAAKA